MKYNTSTSHHLDTNVLWKFYQKKASSGYVNTPASLLISPTDKDLSVNSNDFSFIGNNVSRDSLAFSKIHRFNKVPSSAVLNSNINDSLTLERLSNLYLTPTKSSIKTYQYGSSRQHNFSSLNTVLPSFSTLLDYTSFVKFFDFSFNASLPTSSKLYYDDVSSVNTPSTLPTNHSIDTALLLRLSELEKSYTDSVFLKDSSSKYNLFTSFLSKFDEFKNTDNLLTKKASTKSSTSPIVSTIYSDLTLTPKKDFQAQNMFTSPTFYVNKDLKHPNTQFLSPDKNTRGTVDTKLVKGDFDVSTKQVFNTW